MGKLALAAKITHVPSMYLSELDGPGKGRRQAAIDGHIEIGRRCRELGVDTIVVFDTHWLVNASYHVNCAPHFKGTYTSNELPHFISNMPFEFPGNPTLGKLLAGPVFGEDALLTAELDLSIIPGAQMDFDPVGHYARPDVFSLHVNTAPQRAVQLGDQ